jgi:hypothetical protein
VTQVSWSRWEGKDCIRVRGLVPGTAVQVRSPAPIVVANLPPMSGQLAWDGEDACFVPRFAFVDGLTYTVLVDGEPTGILVRPRGDRPPTTVVLEIAPTATEVPRNLLRFYVHFSSPMSEGYAARHVRLVDDGGNPVDGALLPTEHELWDGGRQRLTVLLDPSRIKRGLVGHDRAGYPLQSGSPFRLVVDEGFRDARGDRLLVQAQRHYQVGREESRRVDPDGWALEVPSRGTLDPLVVRFDRPLDRGLLARCLRVVGPDGGVVVGTPEVGSEERSWRLMPRKEWVPESHGLVVEALLEDVAGNSVSRVFDRDLRRADQDPRDVRPFTLTFRPL